MAAIADDSDDMRSHFRGKFRTELHYNICLEMRNSPLYWSMVDAGLEEVGQKDVHKIKPSSSHVDNATNSTQIDKRFLWSQMCTWYSKQLTSFLSLKHVHKGQVQQLHSQVFETLARSSLLSEEDYLFLQDLKAERQQEKTHVICQSATRKPLAIVFAVIACLLLLAFSLWRPFTFEPWMSVLINTMVVLLLPMLLAQTANIWRCRKIQRKGEGLMGSVRSVLRAADSWSYVGTKCVRFIQESELVARGFTFVGQQGTSRVVKELHMTSTQRQCPQLRKTLFLASRSVFFTWRRSFAHLVHLCPVNVEVSGIMSYCSEIPLSQYPMMLQHNDSGHMDEEAVAVLHEMSDGFSIDVLKSLQELNHIHMSEFLRRLAVCFVDADRDVDLWASLQMLLDTTSNDLERLHKDVLSYLTAHRRGSLNTTFKSRKSVAWQPESSAGQLKLTYTAVHSLELHLLAALKKIQDLSESMEEKLEEDKDQHLTDADKGRNTKDDVEEPLRDNWTQILSLVRSELGACNGCLEEGMKRLDKKGCPATSMAAAESLAPPAPATPSAVTIVKVSAQDNPIILDEVFEAYSEPQDMDSWRGRYELTASEEEAWQKRQKKNLKLCLNELQSIIDVRAAQRQERERIAMDRMKQSSNLHNQQMPGLCERDNNHEPMAGDITLGSVADRSKEKRNEDSESMDDLTKDIEERVEFWRQFNQRENSALTNKEISRTKNTEVADKEIDQRENAVLMNTKTDVNDGKGKAEEAGQRKSRGDRTEHLKEAEEAESSHCEDEHSESSRVIQQDSSYSSMESGFVFVSEQSGDDELTDSEANSGQLDSDSTDKENLRLAHSVQNTHLFAQYETTQDCVGQFSHHLPSDVSLLEQNGDKQQSHYSSEHTDSLLNRRDHMYYGNDNDDDIDHDNKNDDVENLSCNAEEQATLFQRLLAVPQQELTHTNNSEGRDTGEKERNIPEGIAEHLSLPASPSPFAFSIASMVASRARSFAQTEDTFGDSSSEEEDEEERE